MIDHPRKLGLRGYFQSPTIRELARLLVARAFIGTNTLGTHPGQEASLASAPATIRNRIAGTGKQIWHANTEANRTE